MNNITIHLFSSCNSHSNLNLLSKSCCGIALYHTVKTHYVKWTFQMISCPWVADVLIPRGLFQTYGAATEKAQDAILAFGAFGQTSSGAKHLILRHCSGLPVTTKKTRLSNSYTAKLIYLNLFKFSATWSCVSLPRPTTSSGWKLLIFV